MLVDSKMLSFYVCLFVNSPDSTSSFCGNGRKIASSTIECQTMKRIALCIIKKEAILHLHLLFLPFWAWTNISHIWDHIYFKPTVSRELNVIPNKKNMNLACKASGISDPRENQWLFIFWKSFSGWQLLFSNALAIGRFNMQKLLIAFGHFVWMSGLTKFQN